eukprot:m.19979 g.19979  ORF g.19979 m.19979 type:complete len:393 (+) comp27939_c0_seq1:36-1214(+)
MATLTDIPDDLTMDESLFLYSLAYWLFAICFVAPPDAFRSSGLTVQYLFQSYLGSEKISFIGYNIKRTTATLISHAALPIGYTLVGGFFYQPMNVFRLDSASNWIKYYNLAAVVVLISALITARYWSSKNWSRHPLARRLAAHNSDWRSAAASVNIEFRRIDKFVSRTGTAGSRIYVTDSWIIKTATYNVHLAHQHDSHLSILKSEEHPMSVETQAPVQYVWMEVRSIRRTAASLAPFAVRINSSDFGDIKDKLHAPVRNARNVVVMQTLSEQFLASFREHVEENGPYNVDLNTSPPDRCVGCTACTSNVKLVKLCGSGEGDDECRQCYCRPMWCFSCMGKWFASRQDQQRPETWLGSSAPCPTCRARFCILDVCLIPGADKIPIVRDELDD